MQKDGKSTIYEFGAYSFDALKRRLFSRESGEQIPLQPKAAEILSILIAANGELVTKDELIEKVWQDTIVEESNLSQTIFVLRKTLGESKKEPRFILTVPHRGYRFIAEINNKNYAETQKSVEEVQNVENEIFDDSVEKPKRAFSKKIYFAALPILFILLGIGIWAIQNRKPASVKEVNSIAVLPFDDLSDGQTEKYLGIGLADALVNKFGGLKKLTVRPTRTVLKYAENQEDVTKIGKDLQVDAILDGRIQRVGDRIRVSVQLIRTADNTPLWSDNFDDDFTNFFTFQDSISQKVVQSLALELDENEKRRFSKRGTENSAAYEEYLRGNFFRNKRTPTGLQKAVEHFERAVQIDGEFSEAHAGLAETYVLFNLFGADYDREAFPKARVSALRTLQLDDRSAEAYSVLAQIKMQYEFDWKGTENDYLRAIELNPNQAVVRQWYGEFLALQKRTDESIKQINLAIALDPASVSVNNALALPFIISNQNEKAIEICDKVLEMEKDFPLALTYKSRALMRLDRLSEAIETQRRAVEVSGANSLQKAFLAFLLSKNFKKTESTKILSEMVEDSKKRYVSPYSLAIVYNANGETEKALEMLERAFSEHDFMISTLSNDSSFLNLNEQPRFKDLMKRINREN